MAIFSSCCASDSAANFYQREDWCLWMLRSARVGVVSLGGPLVRPPIFDGLPSLRAPLFFFIPRNISPALISARMRMSVACSISSRSLAWCA